MTGLYLSVRSGLTQVCAQVAINIIIISHLYPVLPEVVRDSRTSTAMLHDVILPTVVTMFTVILSIAACILLLIIKKQWDTYPEFQHQQVGHNNNQKVQLSSELKFCKVQKLKI